MKVSEAITQMSKSYLQRIIDSFTRDFPRLDEERAREIVARNVTELTSRERVQGVLETKGCYSDQLLTEYTLEVLLGSERGQLIESEITNELMRLESDVIRSAEDPDCLKYADAHAVDILRSVLEVALEDDQVTPDELNLISKLQDKLSVSESTKRLILAQLNHFPRTGNEIHSPTEIRECLNALQRMGLIFYCNKLDGGQFVMPDEIAPHIRSVLGIELSQVAYTCLLEALTTSQLSTVLDSANLPRSGRKDDLIHRIIQADIKPRACLDTLPNDDLYGICKSLPGAKVSGTKQTKTDRIVDYFSSLVFKDVSDDAAPGEIYFEYLVELAHRDRENLLANKVISKDKDIENAFEEGTRYLFSEVLGIDLLKMPGNEHPDGCFAFGRHEDLLMWDNKSKESVYTFPDSHLRQFKRYIRDSERRVSCFLVIVPELVDRVDESAFRLKVESGTDTDIALITAEDLLFVARQWIETGSQKKFNAEVFNMTGVLTRRVLSQRLKLFA